MFERRSPPFSAAELIAAAASSHSFGGLGRGERGMAPPGCSHRGLGDTCRLNKTCAQGPAADISSRPPGYLIREPLARALKPLTGDLMEKKIAARGA